MAIAKAYGIYADKGDGNDILDIYKITQKAIQQIQEGNGPAYLEFDTTAGVNTVAPILTISTAAQGQKVFLGAHQKAVLAPGADDRVAAVDGGEAAVVASLHFEGPGVQDLTPFLFILASYRAGFRYPSAREGSAAAATEP